MGRSYAKFLKGKGHADDLHGFEPTFMPEQLFGFQRHLTEWAVRKGRAAIFAGCGLGKSAMLLTWAENMVRKFNKPVLVLTPLAVAPQMVKEGDKFGIECKQTRDGKVFRGINVTNYERLKNYDPMKFVAVVADESSIIKNALGKMRRQITDFLHKVNHRLLDTATPSPNDYMELGTSSEALGQMDSGQMLGMFFTNGEDQTQHWILKGHARKRFWQWICTWARALQRPSDLGFSDDGFILPPLNTNQFIVRSPIPKRGFGLSGAITLDEQRAERRATIRERCGKVAELIVGRNDYSIAWCHLNPEGDLLAKLIPGAVQVSGSDSLDEKEERLAAFAAGQIKVLVTKPRIGAFGLNLQHCNHMTMFPSHSYEQAYQAVRRCWRFGQKRPVFMDVVTSEAESRVVSNMRRKSLQMEAMFSEIVEAMNEFQSGKKPVQMDRMMALPEWLRNGKVHG